MRKRRWTAVTLEITGTAHHNEWERMGEPHCNHVGRDELAEPDSSVESATCKVDHLFACCDLHLNLWMGLAKGRDYRVKNERHDAPGYRQAQQSHWTLTKVPGGFGCRN